MKLIEKKVLNDKFLGSFIGAMVGDALGWPQEDRSMKVGKRVVTPQKAFHGWERRCSGRFYKHIEEIKEGEYSDDSQLLIATARSLQNGENWYSHFVKLELPTWLLYERGGGGATKRACKLWISGTPPWKSNKETEVNQYFQAGGNGVAMRILPHVFFSYNNKEELIQQVFKNGIATHGHPRAIVSAIFYACALRYLLLKEEKETLGYGELIDHLIENKQDWSVFPNVTKLDEWFTAANYNSNGKYLEVWDSTVEEIQQSLNLIKERLALGIMDSSEETLSLLKCFDSKFRGAGTTTALVAVYLASKYATEPITGLLEAAYLKNADTDTIASMVGGLFGVFYGSEWLSNEWLKVQDYEYIQKLINTSLRNSEQKEQKKIALWSSSDKTKFIRDIEKLSIGNSLSFGPFEEVVLVDKFKNEVLVKGIQVITYKFESSEKQTLYIKSISKVVSDKKNINDVNENKGRGDSFLISADMLKQISYILPDTLSAKEALTLISDIMDEQKINNNSDYSQLINKLDKYKVPSDTIIQIIKVIKNK